MLFFGIPFKKNWRYRGEGIINAFKNLNEYYKRDK